MPVALLVVLVVAAVLAIVLLEFRGEKGGRRIIAALVILALAGVTAYILLETQGQSERGSGSIATSPPATPSLPTATPSSDRSAIPSSEPTIVRYEAALPPGGYTLFRVTADGRLLGERSASFDRASMAPVDRVEASNGLVHWRTVVGALAGLSYVPGRSGPFEIREVLRWPDGTVEARLIDPGS